MTDSSHRGYRYLKQTVMNFVSIVGRGVGVGVLVLLALSLVALPLLVGQLVENGVYPWQIGLIGESGISHFWAVPLVLWWVLLYSGFIAITEVES